MNYTTYKNTLDVLNSKQEHIENLIYKFCDDLKPSMQTLFSLANEHDAIVRMSDTYDFLNSHTSMFLESETLFKHDARNLAADEASLESRVDDSIEHVNDLISKIEQYRKLREDIRVLRFYLDNACQGDN